MLENGVKKAFYSALFKALAMSSKGCKNGGVLGSSKDFKALFNCIWHAPHSALKIAALVSMISLALRSPTFKENPAFCVCIVIPPKPQQLSGISLIS